jgi:hypothetical protein
VRRVEDWREGWCSLDTSLKSFWCVRGRSKGWEERGRAGWNLRPSPLTMGRSMEPAACYLIISEWFLFLALNIYPYWVFTASQALYLLFFAVVMATTPGVQLLSDFK